MIKIIHATIYLLLVSLLMSCTGMPVVRLDVPSGPTVVDHRALGQKVPQPYIQKAKQTIGMYYGHTSHGEQPIVGLEMIESQNSSYSVNIDNKYFLSQNSSVSILDVPYVPPEHFWASARGRKSLESLLRANAGINLVMWAWCGQMGHYSPTQVREYLDVMAGFEDQFPDVVFVYVTGHAQYGGLKGYTRFKNNNLIRSWVLDHPDRQRVLYDFADLDTWWLDPETQKWEQSTYIFISGGRTLSIPIEHQRFRGEEQSHTTYESCLQKGRATWWMFSVLSGWR